LINDDAFVSATWFILLLVYENVPASVAAR